MKVIAARWPGKSAPEGGLEHPALLHMLDVAAVAERLIAPQPYPHPVKAALTLLSALHDLGKISDSFRAMLRGGSSQSFRHWEITEALLWRHDPILAETLGGRDMRRQELYAATAGHHGFPSCKLLEYRGTYGNPRPVGHWRAMLDAAGAQAETDAAEVIRAFRSLWPGASLDSLTDLAEAKRLSWQLNGLLTVADWVGSNAQWFPPAPPTGDLAAYLDTARDQVGTALDKAGLVAPPVASGPLFDFALRPMQAACAAAPLKHGPMLALIEDDTGAGKTEAALILAQKWLLDRKGQGLYFALPTMATADAMFRRLRSVLPRLFDGAPSVTLAHGRAGLYPRPTWRLACWRRRRSKARPASGSAMRWTRPSPPSPTCVRGVWRPTYCMRALHCATASGTRARRWPGSARTGLTGRGVCWWPHKWWKPHSTSIST